MRRGLLVVLVLVAACRIEPLDDGKATDSLAAEGLPVTVGDTIRVGPEEAPVAADNGERHVASSGYLIPVAGVAPEDLVDTFTDARRQGRRHDAIDILAPRGTPVLAARPGRVLRLFESDKGGLTVYQLADERTVLYYAHLDGYADGLAEGDALRRGETLGYVGDTGNAAPGNYHLHFALWRVVDPADFWEGEAINPYPLLGGE